MGRISNKKRSTKDFQDELDSCVKFYFDVLGDIDEIKNTLKEMTRIMRPNLGKFDKSKYPKYDPALYRKLLFNQIQK